MTSIAMRAVCAAMSTLGATGLVMFADPANTSPSTSAHRAPLIVAAVGAAPVLRHG